MILLKKHSVKIEALCNKLKSLSKQNIKNKTFWTILIIKTIKFYILACICMFFIIKWCYIKTPSDQIFLLTTFFILYTISAISLLFSILHFFKKIRDHKEASSEEDSPLPKISSIYSDGHGSSRRFLLNIIALDQIINTIEKDLTEWDKNTLSFDPSTNSLSSENTPPLPSFLEEGFEIWISLIHKKIEALEPFESTASKNIINLTYLDLNYYTNIYSVYTERKLCLLRKVISNLENKVYAIFKCDILRMDIRKTLIKKIFDLIIYSIDLLKNTTEKAYLNL